MSLAFYEISWKFTVKQNLYIMWTISCLVFSLWKTVFLENKVIVLYLFLDADCSKEIVNC